MVRLLLWVAAEKKQQTVSSHRRGSMNAVCSSEAKVVKPDWAAVLSHLDLSVEQLLRSGGVLVCYALDVATRFVTILDLVQNNKYILWKHLHISGFMNARSRLHWSGCPSERRQVSTEAALSVCVCVCERVSLTVPGRWRRGRIHASVDKNSWVQPVYILKLQRFYSSGRWCVDSFGHRDSSGQKSWPPLLDYTE